MSWKFALGIGGACFFLASAAFTGSAQGPSSDDAQARILVVELQQDFKVLRSVLEESHPGLYRYTPKGEMDRAFDEGLLSLDHAMDEREFFAIITRVLARIKDGHTRVYLSPELRKKMNATARLLPLHLRFVGHRAFIIASPATQIEPGSELLALNGEKVESMTRDLFEHLYADADIETGKYADVDADFATQYYLFVGQPDLFQVQYRSPQGLRKTIALSALAADERAKALTGEKMASASETWKYEKLPTPHVARLIVATFAPPDPQADFDRFLLESFRRVQEDHIDDLVIDLRGNDGGENYGPALFAYLTDRPFVEFDSAEAKSKTFPLLHQYSHLENDFESDFTSQLVPAANGWFDVTSSEFLPPIQHPREPHYAGRVWVLIDGRVFSTGAEFCSIVYREHRGRFVGEETGGAYHGNTSGEIALIRLPASKIGVTVPLIQYTMATKDRAFARHGVIPHNLVEPNVTDFLERHDTVLEKTLELIRQAR